MKFVACKVKDIPSMGNPDNPFVGLLFEFLESEAEAAEVTNSVYGLGSTTSALRGIVTRNNLPVKVVQRQKRVFVIRDRSKEAAK